MALFIMSFISKVLNYVKNYLHMAKMGLPDTKAIYFKKNPKM